MFTYLQSTRNYMKYQVWGVTFKCECWCHRVNLGSWELVELDNCKLCAYLLPFSQRVERSVMFISNPPALIWRKFLALYYCLVKWSGQISPPHLRWKCFLFRIDRIGREGGGRGGLKVDGNMKKTNYTEKYQICHLLIHNPPGAWLRAQRNYYLLMVMAWWSEGAIVPSRRKFNRINESINKCWGEGKGVLLDWVHQQHEEQRQPLSPSPPHSWVKLLQW